jgi:hypothetical protein
MESTLEGKGKPMQRDAVAEAEAMQLPCSPMSLVLALLVQRCADKHSAVCSRAMTGLSKTLSFILDVDRTDESMVQWLQPLAHAVCNASCLELATERVVAEAGPIDHPEAADRQLGSSGVGYESTRGMLHVAMPTYMRPLF